MTIATQMKLVKTRQGRIVLHLCAILRNKEHRFIGHIKGIIREVALQGKSTV